MAMLDAAASHTVRQRYPDVFRRSLLKRFRVPIVGVSVIAYLCFAWWLFGVGATFSKASWDIASVYLADWVSYEVRPEIALDDDHLTVTFPRFSPLGKNPDPDWLEKTTKTIAVPASPSQSASDPKAPATSTQSSAGSFMAPADPAASSESNPPSSTSTQSSAGSFMAPGAATGGGEAQTGSSPGANAAASQETVSRQATGTVDVTIGAAQIHIVPRRVEIAFRGRTYTVETVGDGQVVLDGSLPDFARQREAGGTLTMFFGFPGSIEIRDDEIKLRRRFWGWQNFVFDTNSPFFGKSASQVAHLIVSGERIDPSRSNLALAWSNVLNNAEWQHGDVWIKLGQTIVMAFVGTLFASFVAFPLSFVAARTITRNRPLNQVTKRFFDFQRCIDMLIWALFFTRAFGPGPLAGIAAIFFTDTGTLGKLYSEALENIDSKPREGVRSVGAAPLLVQRFAIIPQVLPVFVSQSLYFWESNTRSATIIGAVGAGGIGLKLWEAMRTNSNWENVAYMVLLILITVFLFDALSNAIRSRLTRVSR